jgi:hypothetical protein
LSALGLRGIKMTLVQIEAAQINEHPRGITAVSDGFVGKMSVDLSRPMFAQTSANSERAAKQATECGENFIPCAAFDRSTHGAS